MIAQLLTGLAIGLTVALLLGMLSYAMGWSVDK